MKKILLIIIVSCTIINLIQAKQELVELEFYFFPAFIPQSNFTFKFDNQSEKLRLVINKPFFKLEETDFEKIEDDSSNYSPSKPNQFKEFRKEINDLNFFEYQRKPHRFYDGISIVITKRFKNGNEEKLEFDCPSRNQYQIEYKILDDFFEILDNVNFKGNQRNYVEKLKDYFDYGLPIKKVNDNPLEFRIHGSLSKNNEIELRQFFKELPSDEAIIFDMRNCGFMGTMFHKYFRRLNRKKEIYYLLEKKNSYPTKEIKNCKVITSKEELK